jgi:hypothetical protein
MIDLIGSVAPTISKALSGNFLGAVSEGLKVFGITGGGKKKLEQCIKDATPEQLAKLKKADNDYKIKLKEIGVDLERLSVKDRNSARKMQIDTRSVIPAVIGCAIITGFFGVLAGMFFLPGVENRALDIMLGSLGTMSMSVVSFYFGSSKGSQDKNHIIKNGRS